MKTKLFLISLIGTFALLTACTPVPELNEVTPKTCVAALAKYFPYSIDEKFIFVNDSLNHRIEAKAYDTYNDGIYPRTAIEAEDGNDLNSEWNCCVYNYMFNSQINPDSSALASYFWVERIAAWVFNNPAEGAASIRMVWGMSLRLSMKKPQEYFTAEWDVHCKPSELASLLTDTITLSIHSIESPDMDTTIVEGSCVHIVRDKGIVDFSLDGKTFWRRGADVVLGWSRDGRVMVM